MLQFFKRSAGEKRVSVYLTLAGVICMIAALLLYSKNGITQFSASLSSSALIFTALAAVLGFISIFVNTKYLRFAAYLSAVYAFMMFIRSQITYIANVFVSIDGNSFSAGFVWTFDVYLAGILLFIIGGCLTERCRERGEKR